MTYDASSRKDIRRAEKVAAQDEGDRINYLCAAMSTTQGRAWFHNLLERCHVFQEPFTGIALTESFLKGERTIGLSIFADISQHCPDSYITMIKEANGRRITNDTASRNPIVDRSGAEPASPRQRPIGEDSDRGDEGSVNDPADDDGEG